MNSRKLFRKISVLFLTVALMATMLFAGCGASSGGGGSASANGVKALYTGPASDTFKQLLMDSLAEAATAAGATLDFGEPCATVNDQVEQIRNAVSSGYDAIICLPLDKDTALQLQAAAGETPIIYVNACPDDQFLKANKFMAVCSLEEEAGKFQAEYVYNKLGQPSSLNIVILRGELTHNAAVSRSVSVKHWFQDHGVQANVVFDDTANWSPDEADEVFNVFLDTKQPFDAVFCNNDDMALGVCRAMKRNRLDMTKIPVVGVDATAAGCQSILDGEMQFTVYQSAKGQAEKAIELLAALTSSGDAAGIEGLTENGLTVLVPFEPVTADNVKDYM